MSEKPNRQWFRFHLLTLVLMALAAGGMLLLNASKSPGDLYHVRPKQPIFGGLGVWTRIYTYGWPATAMETFGEPLGGNDWRAWGVAIDICVGVVIVMTVALVSEFLLRREARRP